MHSDASRIHAPRTSTKENPPTGATSRSTSRGGDDDGDDGDADGHEHEEAAEHMVLCLFSRLLKSVISRDTGGRIAMTTRELSPLFRNPLYLVGQVSDCNH